MIRRVRIHQRDRSSIRFNATAMVDVMFMLSIFFMLITRLSEEELVRMQLPNPEQSQAKAVKLPDRIIINCLPADRDNPEAGVIYKLGPNRPEPLSTIRNRLVEIKTQQPNLKVVVRADRTLPYANVRALMRVLAGQDIEMLNVAAHVAEGT